MVASLRALGSPYCGGEDIDEVAAPHEYVSFVQTQLRDDLMLEREPTTGRWREVAVAEAAGEAAKAWRAWRMVGRQAAAAEGRRRCNALPACVGFSMAAVRGEGADNTTADNLTAPRPSAHPLLHHPYGGAHDPWLAGSLSTGGRRDGVKADGTQESGESVDGADAGNGEGEQQRGARTGRVADRDLVEVTLSRGPLMTDLRSVRHVGEAPPIGASELKSPVTEDEGLRCLLHADADLLALIGAKTSRGDTLTTDAWAPVIDWSPRQ